jgi:uncharacterized protein
MRISGSFLIFLAVIILLDLYVFQAVKEATRGLEDGARKGVHIGYWALTLVTFLAFFVSYRLMSSPEGAAQSGPLRAVLGALIFSNAIFKLVTALLLSTDDLRRGIFVLLRFVGSKAGIEPLAGLPVSRSEFFSKAALAVAAVPAIGMAYGVAKGGHKYVVHRHRVVLPNLPRAFDGMRIVQLSDIHSGSFYSRAGVEKGIALANAERPDLIVFTGDLVNNNAFEIEPWMTTFGKLTAKMGVYSILGNHDYGDYVAWESPAAKQANLTKLIRHHRQMGWNIMLDDHTVFERRGASGEMEKLALIGIQNWGARVGFPKYGNLAKAVAGTEEIACKILLSHDPSHWRAQVVPEFSNIALQLSGHTHGMQFGIETKFARFSPVQFVYPEWAGLYQEGNQQLYVNRGFGFIGYPGRLGIWPEITVLELACG